MDTLLKQQPPRITSERQELINSRSRPVTSLSRVSCCHYSDSFLRLENRDSFSAQNFKSVQSSSKRRPFNSSPEKTMLVLNTGLGRVRTASVCRRFDCTAFSNSCCRRWLTGHRFAVNSESSNQEIAGFPNQSIVGESRIFRDTLILCHQREPALRARSAALGHSPSDDEDADPCIEEQDNEGNTTESLPPSQPTISSWVLRLWKVDWARVIFGLSHDEKPWTVPWTGQTIFQVMFLWFAAFWLVGSWIIPIAAQAAGFSKQSLTYRGQALYSLVTDIAEGTVGLGILYKCLTRFHPLPNEWFPVSWRGTWYVEACLGCLMFPLVNRLSQLNLDILPFPAPFNSSHVEQSIMARDPVATLLYAVVVSVCAPIWEEVMFRGFLLPSLTRYLPVWGSVIVSAIAFALAHFSLQDRKSVV